MWHTAQLIERLQGEVEEQQQLRSRFEEMEWGGLHELLNKGYERKYGTIWPKRRVQLSFTPPQREPSRFRQTGTPYPQSVSSSSSPRPMIIQYSPTTSDFIKRSPSPSTYPIRSQQQTILHNVYEEIARWHQEEFSSPEQEYYSPTLGSRGNPIEILDDWLWDFNHNRGVMLRFYFHSFASFLHVLYTCISCPFTSYHNSYTLPQRSFSYYCILFISAAST